MLSFYDSSFYIVGFIVLLLLTLFYSAFCLLIVKLYEKKTGKKGYLKTTLIGVVIGFVLSAFMGMGENGGDHILFMIGILLGSSLFGFLMGGENE